MDDIGVAVLGAENIRCLKPSTGAEDFTFFAMACPSTTIMMGYQNEEKGVTCDPQLIGKMGILKENRINCPV
jgi:metal-dependent amidase/aminoacylase/carboxypeptidase family protein